MQVHTGRLDDISKMLYQKKVVSFAEIFSSMICSSVTLRRDLKTLEAMSSYTHRGSYVTLPDIAKFTRYGIWFYRGVGFSMYGSSLNTIVGLIEQSKTGFTREQLEEILRIGISKQIQILVERERVHRVKLGNKYLYIPEAAMQDNRRRVKLVGDRHLEERFEKAVRKTDLIALLKAVLVEKQVGTDEKSIKRIAKKYSLQIPLKKIEQLLLKYDLPEKKTP